MNDNRSISRLPVVKVGTIDFGGGSLTCVIRDLSIGGAGLDVVSSVGIPDRFTLLLRTDGVHVPCRVAWREECRLGVVFEDLDGNPVSLEP
jgi:hypothetical protein